MNMDVTRDTIKDVGKLRHAARYHAKRKGYSDELADDFAQEAVMQWLGGRKATTAQLLTDFLRKSFGSSRQDKSDSTEANRRTLLTAKGGGAIDTLDGMGVMSLMPDEFGPDFNTLLEPLKGQIRAYFYLVYQWGLTGKEIGEAFGVTEGRISQQMKQAIKTRKKSQKRPALMKRTGQT